MEFKHINDCWDFIATAKNTDELQEKLDQLPIWSGGWEFIVKGSEDGSKDYQVIVTNTYFDRDSYSYEEDAREVDVICEEAEGFELPWEKF